MNRQKISICILLVLSIAVFLFSCVGAGKNKETGNGNDSLDSTKAIADSLKKAKAAKPTFLIIQGTNVNLRKDPNVKSIRIRQLKTNDTCAVLEKGKNDTINGTIDCWYKIKSRTKEGWVFGAFTSLKIQTKKQSTNKIFFKEK